jgi:hypothetical protein
MKQFPRSRAKRGVANKHGGAKVKRNQKVTTFEESIKAAKILGRAIMAGRIDEAGEVASIDLEDVVYTAGIATGINIKVTPKSDDATIILGRDSKEGWDVERSLPGSNVRYLAPKPEDGDEPPDAEKPTSVRLSITA